MTNTTTTYFKHAKVRKDSKYIQIHATIKGKRYRFSMNESTLQKIAYLEQKTQCKKSKIIRIAIGELQRNVLEKILK